MQTGQTIKILSGLMLLGFCTPSLAQVLKEAPQVLTTLDQACKSSEGQIVVCGRRDKTRSPYRLPEPPPRFDAGAGTASVSRERHGLYEHGSGGASNCSTVGPGGYTGCSANKKKEGYEQWGGKHAWERKRPSEFQSKSE
jgi:hypothetical protein